MHHDQDIALAMKRCEYIATVVGDLEFDDRRQSSEPVAHPLKQFWHRRYQQQPRSQWLRARVFGLFEDQRTRS